VTDEADFVVIGLVKRPHGTAGEVGVQPVSEVRERFASLTRVLVMGGGSVREVGVEAVRRKGETVLIKLDGVNDRDAAQALAGHEIGVRKKDVWPLPEGSYYIFDLVGCRVVGAKGRLVGLVEDVLGMPANDVLVVRTDKGEALVPVTRNVVQKVDLAAKVIVIEELEGLLG
jgi:16S rRNA processing protein RimM